MAELNADLSRRVVLTTASMDWQESPSPNVLRKRLDLIGPPEAGRVTSVVQYRPDSKFPSHPHPDGEEILVLDGVFADEHGRYPAGTYLLNPEGFSHAPFSEEGCVLFVKLRQYPGTERRHVAIDPRLPSGRTAAPAARSCRSTAKTATRRASASCGWRPAPTCRNTTTPAARRSSSWRVA